MTYTRKSEAQRLADDLIRNRRADIEDRQDVKWYMEEMDIPENQWDAVWIIVCRELHV